MEVGSVDAQIDWAEAGFGVAIIPEFAISTKRHLHSKVTPLTDFSTLALVMSCDKTRFCLKRQSSCYIGLTMKSLGFSKGVMTQVRVERRCISITG